MTEEKAGLAPLPISDVRDLIPHLELDGIQFYKLEATFDDEIEPDESREGFVTAAAIRRGSDYAHFRCSIEAPYPRGNITVDAAAMFSAAQPLEFDDDVALDFADNVAIMVLLPYLRQAISDMGQRLGVTMTFPILPRGAISFRGDEVAPESEEEQLN